ncbi:MAG: hypothetical protein COB53_08260 [Elusimicrobia bacterium]|nr:MAG: hypothetical protein COB53_08260 [Elusimicrobiota bacterium]
MSPGTTLVGPDGLPLTDAERNGLPVYARSGRALEEEKVGWLDRWPYILAVLLAFIGVLIWKLDLR